MTRCALIFSTLFVFCTAEIFAQEEPTGRTCSIKSMVGSVKIRRGASVKWIDARPNMPIKEADAVRTFVESEATVQTSEGSLITLGENSTFELSAFAQNGANATTKVKILNGALVSNIKKLANANSTFDFETPTATASIRGTKVGFSVNGDESDIKVYEGKVMVAPKGSDAGKELKANEMTTVKKGQKTIEVVVLKEKPGTVLKIPESDPVKPDSIKAVIDTTKKDTSAIKALADTTKKATADSTRPAIDTTKKSSAIEATLSGQTQTASRTYSVEAGVAPTLPLKLTIMSPSEGQAITTLPINVTGMSTAAADIVCGSIRMKAGADGSFSGQISIPASESNYALEFEATLGTQSMRVTRNIVYKPPMKLIINSPRDNQLFTQLPIIISGITNPGAEVSCGGLKTRAGADGSFTGQVPIPDEDNEALSLDIEVTLGTQSQSVSRTIIYRKDILNFSIEVYSPGEGQKIQTRQIPFNGKVTPYIAELTMNGASVSINKSNGSFITQASIPDEPGTFDFVFDATVPNSGKTKSLTRRITYERPRDILVPQVQGSFPAFTKIQSLLFTVIDKTIDEEITFIKEIDGSKETETGIPGVFRLNLLEGIHTYSMYATDKTGNTSPRLNGTVIYTTKTPIISLSSPRADISMRIPPKGPESSFSPTIPIIFTVGNLPDEQPATIKAILKEVRVTNQLTGTPQIFTNLSDNDFSVDVELKPGVNPIEIKATDIQSNIVTKTVTIRVQ